MKPLPGDHRHRLLITGDELRELKRHTGAMAEAQTKLPGVEANLARARGVLEELERRASSQGVPLEWRR